MLVRSDQKLVFDWQEEGIWTFDVSSRRAEIVSVGRQHLLKIYGGSDDHVVVERAFYGGGLEYTVRSLWDVDNALARARIIGDRAEFSGDAGAWARVPRVFHSAISVFRLEPERGAVRTFTIDYREGHPGLTDDSYLAEAVELPDGKTLALGFSRHDDVELYDPEAGRTVKVVELPRYHGGARGLRFVPATGEWWAIDSDTLVAIDPKEWKVSRMIRLQPTEPPATSLRLGEFSLSPDGRLCAVARPFSGDVIGLDVRSFLATSAASLGPVPASMAARKKELRSASPVRWPVLVEGWAPSRVAVLDDGTVVARDHVTKDPVVARLEPLALGPLPLRPWLG